MLSEQFALSESWGGAKSGHPREEAETREQWVELLQERTLAERAVAPP